MKINEETTVSEEQVLFNKLNWEEQQFILKQMKLLQPCELKCEEEEEPYVEVCGSWFTKSEYDSLFRCEEEKKIPEKLKIRYKDTETLVNEKILQEDINDELASKINSIIDYLKSKGDE